MGWSHGREKLEGNKLDLGKGSFYFNPLTDNLVESMLERWQKKNENEIDDDTISVLKWDESLNSIKNEEELKKLAQSQPGFFAPNVWPTKTIPELKVVAKEVGDMIHQVGIMIAKCCDSYVSARVRWHFLVIMHLVPIILFYIRSFIGLMFDCAYLFEVPRIRQQ